MEYSQVVRHRFLISTDKGSNPFTPEFIHVISSISNEITRQTTNCKTLFNRYTI
jgi:hypothetical protein